LDVKFFYFMQKSLRTQFKNNASRGIFLDYSEKSIAYKILDTTINIIIKKCRVFLNQTRRFLYKTHCNLEFSNFILNYEIL